MVYKYVHGLDSFKDHLAQHKNVLITRNSTSRSMDLQTVLEVRRCKKKTISHYATKGRAMNECHLLMKLIIPS